MWASVHVWKNSRMGLIKKKMLLSVKRCETFFFVYIFQIHVSTVFPAQRSFTHLIYFTWFHQNNLCWWQGHLICHLILKCIRNSGMYVSRSSLKYTWWNRRIITVIPDTWFWNHYQLWRSVHFGVGVCVFSKTSLNILGLTATLEWSLMIS